jgi:hypothetical protein
VSSELFIVRPNWGLHLMHFFLNSSALGQYFEQNCEDQIIDGSDSAGRLVIDRVGALDEDPPPGQDALVCLDNFGAWQKFESCAASLCSPSTRSSILNCPRFPNDAERTSRAFKIAVTCTCCLL